MSRFAVDKINVEAIHSHRNGVGGAGFYVVKFNYVDDDDHSLNRMVAVCFYPLKDGELDYDAYWENVAVLDSHPDNIVNRTMRGADYFGSALKQAIKKWNNIDAWHARSLNNIYADSNYGVSYAQEMERRRDDALNDAKCDNALKAEAQ